MVERRSKAGGHMFALTFIDTTLLWACPSSGHQIRKSKGYTILVTLIT